MTGVTAMKTATLEEAIEAGARTDMAAATKEAAVMVTITLEDVVSLSIFLIPIS